MPSSSNDVYEFGPCRLDAGQRILTRAHKRVPLAPKAFELLLLLVRSPGRAFSKQELMTALWGEAFVEEANLSFQISTLRKALGDEGTVWIETVPKHGYRFAADVVANPSAAVPVPARGRRGWRLAGGLIAGLMVLGAGFLFLVRSRPSRAPEASNAVATPLTAYPGDETGPSLSPDGSQVAFSWNGPGEDNHDIYVKVVGLGGPVRLTTAPERDESPAWSPDGGRIAFVRRRIPERSLEVFVTPALGGAERRVASLVLDSSRRPTGLSWSPDGKWVVIGGKLSAPEPFGLWLVEADGSQTRRLTTPPSPGWVADFGPVFSPDGRRIAFIRSRASSNALFILPVSSAMVPMSEPIQIVSDPRRSIAGLAWTPDGRSVVFSWGGHLAPTRLERLDLSPDSQPTGDPQLLPFGERAMQVSVARTGRIVYSALLRDANLWKLDLTRPGTVPVDAGLSKSTLQETTPSYSPDGTEVVFTSTRSGSEELWISGVDGANLRQMTSIGGPNCAGAQWAPDGASILFNSTREGTSDLYLLLPKSGEIRRLTTDPAEEIEASWSRDGRSIYFGSNRTGRFEIWRMPAGGGAASQVTRDGGQTAQESPDRQAIYYAKNGSPTTIWRAALDGSHESQLVDGLSYPNNFVVGDRGIYFLAVGDSPSKTSIDFYEFGTRRRTTLAMVGKPWWSGIALSADQRWLLFAAVDRDGSDLMLVDRANLPVIR